MKATRLFQTVGLAALLLIAIKLSDIITSGRFPPSLTAPALAQDGGDAMAETGADAAPGADAPALADPAFNPDAEPDVGPPSSSAERAILIRLSERRAELEAREDDLLLRERLLEAAEQRLEDRLAELRALEQQLTAAAEEGPDRETENLNRLVQMYENMKPKDAARIFNRLDMDVLVSVVEQMKPRTMSEVMAAMDPDAAEKLTLALAKEAEGATEDEAPNTTGAINPAFLPKIGADG